MRICNMNLMTLMRRAICIFLYRMLEPLCWLWWRSGLTSMCDGWFFFSLNHSFQPSSLHGNILRHILVGDTVVLQVFDAAGRSANDRQKDAYSFFAVIPEYNEWTESYRNCRSEEEIGIACTVNQYTDTLSSFMRPSLPAVTIIVAFNNILISLALLTFQLSPVSTIFINALVSIINYAGKKLYSIFMEKITHAQSMIELHHSFHTTHSQPTSPKLSRDSMAVASSHFDYTPFIPSCPCAPRAIT